LQELLTACIVICSYEKGTTMQYVTVTSLTTQVHTYNTLCYANMTTWKNADTAKT